MPDFPENNKEDKRSKVGIAIYGLTYTIVGFFLLAVSFFMAILSPYMGGGVLSYIFLLSPVLVIIVLVSIGISNKSRSKILQPPSEKKDKKYILRLLAVFGLALLGCFILVFFLPYK